MLEPSSPGVQSFLGNPNKSNNNGNKGLLLGAPLGAVYKWYPILGRGVGFQKSKSLYVEKPLVYLRKKIGDRGGVKMTPKHRISFMDSPLG